MEEQQAPINAGAHDKSGTFSSGTAIKPDVIWNAG